MSKVFVRMVQWLDEVFFYYEKVTTLFCSVYVFALS